MKKLLFLFLLIIPATLYSQRVPRFERLNTKDTWTLLATGGDSSTRLEDYIIPASVQTHDNFKAILSRLIVIKKDSTIDYLANMLYDCSDTTYATIRGIKRVNGRIVKVIDHTDDKAFSWEQIVPKTFAHLEFKYLCR